MKADIKQKPLIFHPFCKSKTNYGRKIMVGLVLNNNIYVGVSQSFKGFKTKRPSSDHKKTEWIQPKSPDQFSIKQGRNISLIRSVSAIKFVERCDELSKSKLQSMIDRKYLIVIPIPETCTEVNKLFVDTLSTKYGSIRKYTKKEVVEQPVMVS